MNRHLWLGIDPGKKGGIVGVDRLGQIAFMSPMPILEAMPSMLEGLKIRHVCLEHAQVFPSDGKNRAFNYGVHFGSIQGVLTSMRISFDLIKPRVWQKHMICSPRYQDTKKRALVSANKVFKKTKSFWLPTKRHKVPHDGIVDAALIAEFCRRLKINED